MFMAATRSQNENEKIHNRAMQQDLQYGIVEFNWPNPVQGKSPVHAMNGVKALASRWPVGSRKPELAGGTPALPGIVIPRRTVETAVSYFLIGMCLAALTPVSSLQAQSTNSLSAALGQSVIAAVRVEQGPRIDGILDDACWQTAPPLTNFTQVLPVEGAQPSERTEVRFVYDRDYLYIAVRCFDDAPGRIIAKQMQRDSGFDSDDFVTVAFDTFDRQHDGYFFAVNPVGARTVGLIQNFSDRKFEWDGIWDARARVDEQGWAVELAIPFKSLSFDPARDTWGCNVERVIRRKQETVRWSVLSLAKPATTLSDFAELRGLTGMR
jgi:hypothetical protein